MWSLAWAVAFPRCVCVPRPDSAVPWVQDERGYWYLLDTGAPRTLVRPEAGLELLETEPVVTEALPEDLLLAPTDELIGGLLGADVLLAQPWWREGDQVYFGAPPEGLTLLASVALEPVGGGQTCLPDGQCYDYGATRLLVDLELEGRPLTLLLDTGATYVTLSGAAGEGLGLDPERELAELSARVGDLEQGGVLVSRGDAFLDEALLHLSDEVGRPVDGLLGQSLLAAYVVGISERELTFSTRE
jgi:hypothetical protein